MDDAVKAAPSVKKVLTVRRTGGEVAWDGDRDVWWHEAVDPASTEHAAEIVDAEHPLFILYTSGSTGRPKGVVHTSGGYITYTSYTHATVFDLREDDVYGCVADIGWITGHSYIVYGPLANGRDDADVRSAPDLPGRGPLLGHGGAAEDFDLLHGAHGHSRPRGAGGRVRHQVRSLVAARSRDRR